jgi:heme/copper-type cytochrome/quinol oxidase subunit 2
LSKRLPEAEARATQVRVVPTKLGSFAADCDVCGEGHEEMTAEVVVVP